MKAVIQRVINASVTVDGRITGKIESGILVYLGVAVNDSETDATWLSDKIINLRIFNDNNGIMNMSLTDIQKNDPNAAILVISQFTLLADSRKGRRPSWNLAAPPEKAKKLYEYFLEKIKNSGIKCESGRFQASMKVNYTNDGPVTIILDTAEL